MRWPKQNVDKSAVLERANFDVDMPSIAHFSGLEELGALGLAVSGGPDSMVLMHLAAAWAKPLGIDLFVYTVDHGLRKDAAAECALVADAALALGLPCRVLGWTGSKPKTGLQAVARAARYRLIGTAMSKDGAGHLLTAHHADDQAETLLMRIAHGTGLTGLAGMRRFSRVEDVAVCRPLLDVARAGMLAYAECHQLEFVRDPSNQNEMFERVRWREILPDLSALGLGVDRLSLLSKRAARAEHALAELTMRIMDGCVTADPLGVLHLPLDRFRTLSPEIGIRALGEMVDWAGNGKRRFALGKIEELHAELTGASAFTGRVLFGAAVELYQGDILIFREIGRQGLPSFDLGSGETKTWDHRFEISLQDGAPPVTISPASIGRKDLNKLWPDAPDLPMRCVQSAPMLQDSDGNILSLGSNCFDSLATISLAPLPWRTKA